MRRVLAVALSSLFFSVVVLACSGGGTSFGGGDGGTEEDGGSIDEIDGSVSYEGGTRTCANACAKDEVCSNGACAKLPGKCPCPKEAYCDLASGSCKVGCTSEDGCSSGRYCDLASRQCKDGCSSDQQCGPKKICENHTCATGCRTCEKDDNACTSDKCVDGECRHDPLPDGTSCTNDSNKCTIDSCKAGTCTHEADPTHPVCDTSSYPARACMGTDCKTPPSYCRRLDYTSGSPPSYYFNNALHKSCACSDATHITVTTTSSVTSSYVCSSGCITYVDPDNFRGYATTYFGCF